MAFSDIINRELLSAALGQFKTKLATVFAPLASPAMTGTPTAPTADAGTNTQQIATTAFVKTAVDAEASRADGAIEGKNVLVVTLTGVNVLPVTLQNAEITSDMAVVRAVLSNPAAQLCDWAASASNGYITISKTGQGTGIGYGATDITLYMMHTGSETSQTSLIKQSISAPPAGYYYTRDFSTEDDTSIFESSVVSYGRIRVHRSGSFISVRLLSVTTASALSAGTTYTVATLPENCRIMLMVQSNFVSWNGQYHGEVSVQASAGLVQIIPRSADIPAGTSLILLVPVFNVARDHDDQSLDDYTFTSPNS